MPLNFSTVTNTFIAGSSATDASSYTPATFTRSNGYLMVVVIGNTATSAAVPVPTMAGVTLTQIVTRASGTAGQRLTMFAGVMTANGAATLTIDFAGATQTGCEWYLCTVWQDGYNSGTDDWSDPVAQQVDATSAAAVNMTLALPGAPLSTDNLVLAVFRHAANEIKSIDADVANWTLQGNLTHANPNAGMLLVTNDKTQAGRADGTCTSEWTTSAVPVGIMAEFKKWVNPNAARTLPKVTTKLAVSRASVR